jgi:hypothetical protein
MAHRDTTLSFPREIFGSALAHNVVLEIVLRGVIIVLDDLAICKRGKIVVVR